MNVTLIRDYAGDASRLGRLDLHLLAWLLVLVSIDEVRAQIDRPVQEAWVARFDGPVGGRDGATAVAADQSGNVYVAVGEEPPIGFYTHKNDILHFTVSNFGQYGYNLGYSAPIFQEQFYHYQNYSLRLY